jgi:uncharacterized protein YcnI
MGPAIIRPPKESRVNRSLARLGTVAVAALAAVLAFAAPALAHTEIELDHPQAGATNVTMNVTAEAENDAAGILSVRMVLPSGITPAQVSLVTAPQRWTLGQTSDGFAVAGAPLAKHTDATFAVRFAQLPANATTLVFKTLVMYANGDIDRWIEVPSTSVPNPDHPAPVVTLQPAAAAPTSAAPTTGAPSPSGAPSSSAPATTSAQSAGGTAGWWLGGLLALVVVAGLAAWLVMRRRRAAPPA